MAEESRTGRRIVVKTDKPPVRQTKKDTDTLLLEKLAKVCYYYPGYTLETAQNLKVNQIRILLRVARKLEAEKYLHLTRIAFAPHTEKAKGVEDRINAYRETIEGS